MPDVSARNRTSQGRFIRGKDEIEHDAEAARLRGEGLSYAAIGKRLGISKSHAWEAVQRAFRDTLREPADQARAVELARLEAAHDAAMAVLEREHLAISHGRVVEGPDGTPLVDDAPILQAINTIMRLSESRRRLLGLDAPQRTEVIPISVIDEEIRLLTDELAAFDDAAGTPPPTEGAPD
ncbi:MAG: hypothetical protein HOW97_09555 [Catenulispora sp.]|nr:hypothetical protein [Catenulispora sp.]